MCRNIKTLFNFDPPATSEEVHEASMQFVRKISGFAKPSGVNKPAFDKAVDRISSVADELLGSLETDAKPKNREVEAKKAHERAVRRFGK